MLKTQAISNRRKEREIQEDSIHINTEGLKKRMKETVRYRKNEREKEKRQTDRQIKVWHIPKKKETTEVTYLK